MLVLDGFTELMRREHYIELILFATFEYRCALLT